LAASMSSLRALVMGVYMYRIEGFHHITSR
jgi:hypothetical protein